MKNMRKLLCFMLAACMLPLCSLALVVVIDTISRNSRFSFPQG